MEVWHILLCRVVDNALADVILSDLTREHPHEGASLLDI